MHHGAAEGRAEPRGTVNRDPLLEQVLDRAAISLLAEASVDLKALARNALALVGRQEQR